jgi:beta-1,4-mannosyl-glycoprotein beta-1,4-N-acetylglucosaminyltransferase
MPKHQILDYFLYFNEIELLELRYHMLNDHVTKFVITEGNYTFSGEPKPWRAWQDIDALGLPRHRFEVIETDLSAQNLIQQPLDLVYAQRVGRPDDWQTWSRQRQQRDAVLARLSQWSSDMLWLMGDVDEIPRPDALQYVGNMLLQHPDFVLKLPLVLLEGRADQQIIDESQNTVWWDRSLLMCRHQQLQDNTPWQMRSEEDLKYQTGHAVTNNQRSNDLGWHFTWMGTPARRVTKVKACAHGVNPDTINNMSDRTRRELSKNIGQDIVFQRRLVTRDYALTNLPQKIFELPRVRQFLLPDNSPAEVSEPTRGQGNFVHQALQAGGRIRPLLVPSGMTNGTGLFNPTVLVQNDDVMVNIRHCQYTLLHMERNLLEHEWGPLLYLHPENDCTLTTTNYWAKLDDNLDITHCYAVDTSALDQPPLWEFVGLEDVRMVSWQGNIYYCGVRRDTTTNGEGRMELSHIDCDSVPPREISRHRMPAPGENRSYCEKNWMPVLSEPYTFVKWCNPTEVVRYDPESRTTQQIYLGTWVQQPWDFRGGSQVLDFMGYRVAITHVSMLYNSESGRKDATYRHVMIVWDQDWRVVRYGEPFSFLDAKIEFCCGIASYGNDIVITFGVQDNAAYVLSVPGDFLRRWIGV